MDWQVRHFINLHKGLVIPVVFGMMWWFDCWTTLAATYLGLHGSYSILWLVKEACFRDRRFEQPIPFAIGALFVFLPLIGYYVAPYLITSRHLTASSHLLFAAVFMNGIGVFLHYVSDAQKHFTLIAEKGLITTGLFARTRNPNYLGEMLIYLSFALLAFHWLPFLILVGWWTFFFRNMVKKDKSLSRYPGWEEYKRKSWLLIPKPWN